jgi:hypothetical protein
MVWAGDRVRACIVFSVRLHCVCFCTKAKTFLRGRDFFWGMYWCMQVPTTDALHGAQTLSLQQTGWDMSQDRGASSTESDRQNGSMAALK